MRTLLFFLLISNCFGWVCNDAFKLYVNKQLPQSGKVQKLYFYTHQKKIKKRLKSKVLELCKHQDCEELTEAEMIGLVQDVILDSQATYSNAGKHIVLHSVMISSAWLFSYLTDNLPDSYAFLSFYFVQLSFIMTQVGSPIFEPMSSRLRHWAHGNRKQQVAIPREELERMWFKTQAQYSLNAQMSRNILEMYLRISNENFHRARIAMDSGDIHEAAKNIAISMIRLRERFSDIEKTNGDIQKEFFFNFIRDENYHKLKELISVEAHRNDNSEDAKDYYDYLLDSWFNDSSSQ